MVEVVEGGRLYFPPEDENHPDDRKVMHPETDELLLPDLHPPEARWERCLTAGDRS